jgi:large subunit ribosomal protein L24
MKIHTNDVVQIVLGKDKGKTGKVLRVDPKDAMVLVEGINEYKRHQKARMQGQTSQIVTITKPLHVAKVALLCPKCKKITRVGYTVQKDKKVRICRKCEAVIG